MWLKKVIGVVLLAIIIVLLSIFLFSSDFLNITKIEYQKYSHSDDKIDKVIVIDDDDEINQLTKVLNKANHTNTNYEKAYHEDFKLTLFYEDETSEIIRVWKGFGPNYDLLESDTGEGTYKLKNKKSRETLLEILK